MMRMWRLWAVGITAVALLCSCDVSPVPVPTTGDPTVAEPGRFDPPIGTGSAEEWPSPGGPGVDGEFGAGAGGAADPDNQFEGNPGEGEGDGGAPEDTTDTTGPGDYEDDIGIGEDDGAENESDEDAADEDTHEDTNAQSGRHQPPPDAIPVPVILDATP